MSGINRAMKRNRCSVEIYRGTPKAIFNKIIRKFPSKATNHDYETYAIERDDEIRKLLKQKESTFSPTKIRSFMKKMKWSKTMETPMWSTLPTPESG